MFREPGEYVREMGKRDASHHEQGKSGHRRPEEGEEKQWDIRVRLTRSLEISPAARKVADMLAFFFVSWFEGLL